MSAKSEDRRRELLKVLSQEKKVRVEELQEKFGLSGPTIRKDLHKLEQEGYLKKVWGGAVIKEKLSYEFPFNERLQRNAEEKKVIAKAALSLIKGKGTIFLDSGSTVFQLAKLLKDYQEVTIVTNSLYILEELAYSSGINLIGLGGKIDPLHLAFYGPLTLRLLQEFHFDKAFLGTDGLSIEEGMMTDDLSIAEVERIAIEKADEIIVLADHSKIGKRSFTTTIGELENIDILITDKGTKKKDISRFEQKRIKVIIGG